MIALQGLYPYLKGIYFAGDGMPKATTDAEWSDKAKNLLRSQLKLHGVTYAQLAEKLEAIGVAENEKNIGNKISRGVFTLAFFMQCMEAIGVKEVRL